MVTPPRTDSSIWFICCCSRPAPGGVEAATTLRTMLGRSIGGGSGPLDDSETDIVWGMYTPGGDWCSWLLRTACGKEGKVPGFRMF